MATETEQAKQEILEKLAGIVHEEAGIATEDVKAEKSFTDDLDVDSLTMMSVVVGIEDKFDVKVEDEQIQKIKTVGDAVDFIYEAQNPKA